MEPESSHRYPLPPESGNARGDRPDWSLSQSWNTWLAVDRLAARDADGERFDALIIDGGNDISAEHYGGEIGARVKLDPARDELEIKWIKKAITRDIPLLGICRGAQLINVVLGGNLHQDIRQLRRLTYNRPGLLPTKQVRLDPDSRIAQICGRAHLRVNSLHHQAIRDPGGSLRVVGRDLDQIVQAVEGGPDCRVLGVQWHPEYLFYLPWQFRLFRWLLSKARA